MCSKVNRSCPSAAPVLIGVTESGFQLGPVRFLIQGPPVSDSGFPIRGTWFPIRGFRFGSLVSDSTFFRSGGAEPPQKKMLGGWPIG